MATEKETDLKNHMKWARILVANDGRNIPKGVSILQDGSGTTFRYGLEAK